MITLHPFNASTRGALAALALGALLAGCPQLPPAGDSGIVDAGCAGLVGCECAGGACAVGECLDGTCVDCRRGEAACVCRANGTCNAGLRCDAASRCEACPAGGLGCACTSGGTCGAGLTCSAGTCVTDTCVAGVAGCPCRAGDPKCEATLYCDGMTLCQACSNDVVGCPCSAGGTCAGSTVCDVTSMKCRAPITCAVLSANGGCLPNQACVDMNGMDGTCTPMACATGFAWNGMGCVACSTPGCASEPSCGDLDGGLGTTCLQQNRACVTMGQVGACGTCLPGFIGAATGACSPAPTCGSVPCALSQYCDPSSGTPTCVTLACPPGEAKPPMGACSACSAINCNAPGLSGRIWPIRAATTGQCVCETLDGYFLLQGLAGGATACDSDGDGWVREEADDDTVRANAATKDNARCRINAVDRARLHDEYGMQVEVLSCTQGLTFASPALLDGGAAYGGLAVLEDGGLAPQANGGDGCSPLVPMRLLETLRNDAPQRGTNDIPIYGGLVGRRFEPAEVNALTKGCASVNADFNDNRSDDLLEVQTVVSPNRVVAPDRARLESFAYFVELYTAYTEGTALVIRERSRCSDDFPLRYDPAVVLDGGVPSPSDLYSTASDRPYWRSCARNRDPSFSATTLVPGFDFARFTCADPSSNCPLVPPAHPDRIAPVDPRTELLRGHGLCRLNGAPPADRRWRGMNHHSQFKCVNVQTAVVTDTRVDKLLTDFGPANEKLTFNQCVPRTCATADDPLCSKPQGTGVQTRQPTLDCRAVTPIGGVGFAAVNYRPYRFPDTYQPPQIYGMNAFYRGGCVNEDDEWWTLLCPYPEFLLDKRYSDANFGRYSCYRFGSNFLWGGLLPDGGTNANDRSTLNWGNTPSSSTNLSVLGPRPGAPDGGF